MTRHPGTRLRAAITLICSLALTVTLLAAAPASAASPTACRVKNLDSGITKASLQKAVGVASAGDRLRVQGTCTGTTKIAKRLSITGFRTATSGKPTLDGAGKGTVLTVTRHGTRVKLRSLTIRGGAEGNGAGGIWNLGILTLRGVIVRGNDYSTGAGAYNGGTLVLNGSTSIRDNVGNWGAGVDNEGLLVLNDTSSISGNGASIEGGGVYNGDGGTLRMNDSGSISGNTSGSGGGVYVWHTSTLVGVVCAPEASANVYGNTPDDCFFHTAP